MTHWINDIDLKDRLGEGRVKQLQELSKDRIDPISKLKLTARQRKESSKIAIVNQSVILPTPRDGSRESRYNDLTKDSLFKVEILNQHSQR